MNSIKIVLFAILIVFIVLFSASCDSNTTFDGSQVVVEEPSFIEESSEGKSLIKPTTNISKYMISMIPKWNSTSNAIIGDTRKGQDPKSDNYGFIQVSKESLNNLGFFSQGLWDFTLRAYAKGENDTDVLIYEVKKTVAINSDSTSIKISAKEIMPVNSNTLCTVNLCDFDFLATGPISEYGKENDFGMKLSYKVIDLSSTKEVCPETDIEGISVDQNSDLIGIVNTLRIGNGFSSGAYSLSIFLKEYKNGDWIHTGGVSISFVAVPGIEINISGDAYALDLFRYDYVDVGMGESGIIIDSGTSSSVSMNAYIVSGTSETLVESNVKINNTVRFKPTVKDGPSTITNYKWFIDGVVQPGSAIDTNGYLSFQPSTAKTYTITYMFLDGTNYNTISGNYYLTVVSGT